jgi:glycosyltransferase involved in cell wall biosynthesis
MVETLKQDYEFFIVASDADLDGTIISRQVNTWNEIIPGHHVIYLSANQQNYSGYKRLIKETSPGIVYINGIFSWRFSILPLITAKRTGIKKIIIGIRGMLHESALSIKSFKKNSFLKIAKLSGLYNDMTFHATDEFELYEAKNIFPKNEIKVAGNIPRPLKPFDMNRLRKKTANTLKMIWVGRISKEKNPLFLLEVLKKMPQRLSLDFYGSSIDRDYEETFKGKLKELPENIKLSLKGSQPPEEIEKAMQYADVFIACSTGENFGHAIYEALASGMPVIISNTTPWKDLAATNAGIDLPLEIEKYKDAIQKFYEMEDAEYQEYRQGAYHLAKKYWQENDFKLQYAKIFNA